MAKCPASMPKVPARRQAGPARTQTHHEPTNHTHKVQPPMFMSPTQCTSKPVPSVCLVWGWGGKRPGPSVCPSVCPSCQPRPAMPVPCPCPSCLKANLQMNEPENAIEIEDRGDILNTEHEENEEEGWERWWEGEGERGMKRKASEWQEGSSENACKESPSP